MKEIILQKDISENLKKVFGISCVLSALVYDIFLVLFNTVDISSDILKYLFEYFKYNFILNITASTITSIFYYFNKNNKTKESINDIDSHTIEDLINSTISKQTKDIIPKIDHISPSLTDMHHYCDNIYFISEYPSEFKILLDYINHKTSVSEASLNLCGLEKNILNNLNQSYFLSTDIIVYRAKNDNEIISDYKHIKTLIDFYNA